MIPRSSALRKLNPVVHDGILRVGGRLNRLDGSFEENNPIILPYRSVVTDLIISYEHQALGHFGRDMVRAKLRTRYWVIRSNNAVRRVLAACIPCRRVQAFPSHQLMADLPLDRIQIPEAAFTHIGIDCFGPFYVKVKRSQVKRYGLICVCSASRATHLEVLDDMTTDSFLNGLRRFIARRGSVRTIRSDCGSNFLGAMNELNTFYVQSKLGSRDINIEWITSFLRMIRYELYSARQNI